MIYKIVYLAEIRTVSKKISDDYEEFPELRNLKAIYLKKTDAWYKKTKNFNEKMTLLAEYVRV